MKKELKFLLKGDIIVKVRRKGGQNAGIAQSVEHFTRNEGVVGSSPISGFIYKTQPGKGLRFVH